jgi:hypothetical protein
MDDEALDRLKTLFPDEYIRVAYMRRHREELQRIGIDGALSVSEILADILSASISKPNNG